MIDFGHTCIDLGDGLIDWMILIALGYWHICILWLIDFGYIDILNKAIDTFCHWLIVAIDWLSELGYWLIWNITSLIWEIDIFIWIIDSYWPLIDWFTGFDCYNSQIPFIHPKYKLKKKWNCYTSRLLLFVCCGRLICRSCIVINSYQSIDINQLSRSSMCTNTHSIIEINNSFQKTKQAFKPFWGKTLLTSDL